MNVVDGKVCGGNVALGVVELALDVVFSVVVLVAVLVDLNDVVLGGAVVGDERVLTLGTTSFRGRGALSESNSSSKSSLALIWLPVVVFSVVSSSLTFSEVSDGL